MTSPFPTARQGFDWLDRAAFAYLALPVLIFLLGWLRWWAGIPLAILLLAGSRELWSIRGHATPGHAPIALPIMLSAIGIAVGWSALGGAGHLFFANFDWVTRDSVLRDLVVGAWPVGYGEVDGAPLLLRAPVGYYLPAAVVGKVFGIGAADPALLVWTAIGAALFLGLAVSRVRGPAAAIVVMLVLVLFSGMDLVGTVVRGGLQLATHLRLTDHLEWWADRYQFSSHTTQLFWVPNHALAGWIATALLVRHEDHPEFARVLPLVLALVPIWSPLTAVGLLPLAAVWWLQQLLRRRTLRPVDPIAGVAALAIAIVTGAYLVLGATTIRWGFTTVAGEPLSFYVPHYLQFVLLEGGILWLLLFALRANALLITAGLVLVLLPVAAFGPSNDLAMRASIPALVVLALAAAYAIADPELARQRRVFWPLCVVLLLGVPTAIAEMARAVSEPVWKPDYSQSLVPEPAKDYPAHYATRLTGSSVERLLKPVINVNDRQAGSVPPSSAAGGR